MNGVSIALSLAFLSCVFLFSPSVSLLFSDVTHEVCSHQVTFIMIGL